MAQVPDRGTDVAVVPTGLLVAGLLDLVAYASAITGNHTLTMISLVDASAIVVGTGTLMIRERSH